MSDCQRCAALRMIAEDATLTHAEIVQLARNVLENQPPCGMAGTYAEKDYRQIISLPEPHYDPDDPDNPVLDILLPSVLKKQAGL